MKTRNTHTHRLTRLVAVHLGASAGSGLQRLNLLKDQVHLSLGGIVVVTAPAGRTHSHTDTQTHTPNEPCTIPPFEHAVNQLILFDMSRRDTAGLIAPRY